MTCRADQPEPFAIRREWPSAGGQGADSACAAKLPDWCVPFAISFRDLTPAAGNTTPDPIGGTVVIS